MHRREPPGWGGACAIGPAASESASGTQQWLPRPVSTGGIQALGMGTMFQDHDVVPLSGSGVAEFRHSWLVTG